MARGTRRFHSAALLRQLSTVHDRIGDAPLQLPRYRITVKDSAIFSTMLTNLDAVIERLIAGYEPERIILFGASPMASLGLCGRLIVTH